MKQDQTSNYDFFIRTDTSAYKGEWIAICKNKIIAHGNDAQKVYSLAKQKNPKERISLAKVPDQKVFLLTQAKGRNYRF